MNYENDNEWLERYLYDEKLPEEEVTKRQWQIIDAAIKIFSEKGFEGSRTSDIAKEAEVAEGTIFRYYKTKKELLVGLLMPLIIKFFRPLIFMSLEKILENKENKPVNDIMNDVLNDRLSLVHSNLSLVKTIFTESMYHPELLEPIQKEIAPKFIPKIDEFIDGFIEKGELRDLDPRLVSRTIISLIMGYVFLTRGFPNIFGGKDDKDEIKKIVDIMLYGSDVLPPPTLTLRGGGFLGCTN